MINSVIEGIAKALDGEFGGDYAIYTNSVEQGLQEPCFFITLVSHIDTMYPGNRRFRENLFCIQYLPKNGRSGNEECFEVMDRLVSCLNWIDVGGDAVMGRKMNGELTDGVLNFFVNFDLFVYKAANSDSMEEILRSVSAKGETE